MAVAGHAQNSISEDDEMKEASRSALRAVKAR